MLCFWLVGTRGGRKSQCRRQLFWKSQKEHKRTSRQYKHYQRPKKERKKQGRNFWHICICKNKNYTNIHVKVRCLSFETLFFQTCALDKHKKVITFNFLAFKLIFLIIFNILLNIIILEDHSILRGLLSFQSYNFLFTSYKVENTITLFFFRQHSTYSTL